MNHPTDQSESDKMIGMTLGQFEVLEEVGRGGMATVYRARQTSMNRAVAVKILPRHLLHEPEFYKRFEREVEIISQLEHPHIVPIYEYGQSDGMPYIAMRFLAGGSLAQSLQDGVQPLERLEKHLVQIGQALDYAHRQGIVHRDLKPGNILLDSGHQDPESNAYLSDFGIAYSTSASHLTTGGFFIGTPDYASREQASSGILDARSDIYLARGNRVLYELTFPSDTFQRTPLNPQFLFAVKEGEFLLLSFDTVRFEVHDFSTGQLLWRFDGPLYGTPAIIGDRLIVYTLDNCLEIHNLATGTLIGNIQLQRREGELPTIPIPEARFLIRIASWEDTIYVRYLDTLELLTVKIDFG
jgi:serine/threonine protein kinase